MVLERFQRVNPAIIETFDPDTLLNEIIGELPEEKQDSAYFILSGMTSAQMLATIHFDGACRVIASAGSGKTRVLVARVAFLHLIYGIPLSQIRANTFTKKAAEEMGERFVKLMNKLGVVIRDCEVFSTIHSASYDILQSEWRNGGILAKNASLKDMVIADYEQRDIIKKAIEEVKRDTSYDNFTEDPDVGQFLSQITRWKNSLVHWTQVEQEQPTDPATYIYKRYEELKSVSRKIDFDDMLTKVYHLLRSDVNARQRWQRRWKYVLTDEFQDTNLVQYNILKILIGGAVEISNEVSYITTEGSRNLFVVGDDKQSIYRFRGAEPKIIINYPDEFPGCSEVPLSRNFRSDANVIHIANRLIANNKNQVPLPAIPNRPAVNKPQLIEASDEDDEGGRIVAEIKALKENRAIKSYDEVYVIYRTNAQSRGLEDAFISEKIPYIIRNGIGFYGRKEIKDIYSYFAWFIDSNNMEAFGRIFNTPSRFLGRSWLDSVKSTMKATKCGLIDAIRANSTGRYSDGVGELLWLHRNFSAAIKNKTKQNSELIVDLRNAVKYDAHIKAEGATAEDNDKLANIEQLQQAADRFPSVEEFVKYAVEAGKPVDKRNQDQLKNKVQLMTIHGSKGLERKVVFLSMNMLPHPINSQDQEGFEEERRLAYVGITRAMDFLYMTRSDSYQKRPMSKSQFIDEALGIREDD